jgi:hypothetical protein
MANTYTTSWFDVSDGDTTTHNPQTLVGGSDIRILDADIQWEGVEDTSTTTDYQTNTNYDSATATQSTQTETNTTSDSVSDGTLGASVTIPDEPDGYSFTSGNGTVQITNFDNSSQSYEVEVTFLGNTSTLTGTISGSSQKTIVDDNLIESDTGKTLSSVTSKSSIGTTVTASMTGEQTTTTSQTASTSYPSVPNGYNFENHHHVERRGGATEVDDYIYSNSVGQTESITSTDPNTTVEVELSTTGSTTNTSVNDTENPSVSGDVSGSYSGTLDNGETSPWQSLSGLDPNSETFNHSIGGSFDARFRFRFDWEYVAPTAVHTLKIVDSGTTYSIAVADTSDNGLEYDAIRTTVNGTVYTVDMVDPSNDNAITDIVVQHPTYGKLSPREIQ